MNPNPYGPPPPNYGAGYAPPPQGYAQPYPYGAPAAPPLYRANVFVPPHARGGPLPTATVRKLTLACGITQLGCLVAMIGSFIAAGAIGGRDGEPLAIVGMLFMGVWYLALLGYSVCNAVWIYRMWSWIPPDQRWTNLWKKYTSPGQAAGFMFVPYFNIYWMFVVYLGLGDIFERMRVQYPSDHKNPKDFAIAMLVVSLLFFPAAPFMHYLFDKKCESIAQRFQSQMGVAPA